MSLEVSLHELKMTRIFEYNVTHNLGEMADAAGLYECLWRPEKLGINAKAKDLIPPLKLGLKKLKENPGEYRKYEPENGWGKYDHLVKFVETYIAACEENPGAVICVSR